MGIADYKIKLLMAFLIFVVIFLLCFIVTITDNDDIDKNFMLYLKNHTSGSYLKDIYLDKDFMILFEDFFTKEPDVYEINEYKKNFLITNSFKFNIVVYTNSIYGSKYFKLVEYCRSIDLPVCRIVDLKPSVLVKNKTILDDGTVIYYYTRNKINNGEDI